MTAEVFIVDVKPTTKAWTCRVTVVEKQNIRAAKNSAMRFMPMVLVDSAGTKVQATAFAGDIAGIDERLQLYSTYLISNAYVKPLTELRFCIDYNYQYVWSFTRRAFIQNIQPHDGIDYRQLAEASAKPFKEIFACHMTDQRFSILAIIVAKLPRTFIAFDDKQKLAWDIVVVNEELILVPMTIWEEFVNRHGPNTDKSLQSGDWPVMLLSKAGANIYQGLSLATRYDSQMELNPGGERASLLKNENRGKIKELLRVKEYENALTNIVDPIVQPRITLAELESQLNQVSVAWVSAKLNLINTDGEAYYIGCNYCNRRVYGPEGNEFQCMFCGQKHGQTIKRFILNATLTDNTATIPVTLFTTEVLKMYSYVRMDPEQNFDLEELDAGLQRLSIITGIKRAKQHEEGLRSNPYSIICVCQDGESDTATFATASTSSVSNETDPGQTKRKLTFKTLNDLPLSPTTVQSVLPLQAGHNTTENTTSFISEETENPPTQMKQIDKRLVKVAMTEIGAAAAMSSDKHDAGDLPTANFSSKKHKT